MHSEEDDVARAIAISLAELSSRRPGKHQVINVDSDSDEEVVVSKKKAPQIDAEAAFEADLQRALEASKLEAARPERHESLPESSSATPQPAVEPAPPPFLSERAMLEKARLERQQKRKGLSESDATDSAPAPSKRPRIEKPARKELPKSSSPANLFYDGEVRQTANRHADPAKDTKPLFRLTEIFGDTSTLSFAILTSYVSDTSWIYGLLPPTLPVIFVGQPREDEQNAPTARNILPNWVRCTPRLRGGRGCMHIKLMLLFYKSGNLRVVVTTANFVDYDWRDIENSAWVQDVPLATTPAVISKSTPMHSFPKTLITVLQSLNVKAGLASHVASGVTLPISSLSDLGAKWDWKRVKAQLVPSIAGKFEEWPSVVKVGHTGLMMAVRNVGAVCPKNKVLKLEYQGSSIGTYTTQWLNEFYVSARGESAESWLDTSKARRAKLPLPNIRIVFPSLQTVLDSKFGMSGGGTMFCQKKQWDGKNLPRELFSDSNSKRGGILMHSKMIIATFKDPVEGNTLAASSKKGKAKDDDEIESQVGGWCYVGSHNFTPSAWGTLSGDSFSPIMNITNYELGVLFPLPAEDTERAASDVACFVRPPRAYVRDGDEPWMQDYHGGGQ
ncbi:hypothetical protein BOTBODRAFT_152571 [Botryobasidium botryosum FD-172 SS1]|uniref:PLD phosphodiesterase domain-containing protein n=1 Tax=Botryobasidium botryosum (strain FD-172 SS1) TaxID=930990 RepID=A0A067MWH6_BOTB1|nr:hypothetical protein BOTBODRAFT_152571 [Botryobasidium botryosum FD-172 SS1]